MKWSEMNLKLEREKRRKSLLKILQKRSKNDILYLINANSELYRPHGPLEPNGIESNFYAGHCAKEPAKTKVAFDYCCFCGFCYFINKCETCAKGGKVYV